MNPTHDLQFSREYPNLAGLDEAGRGPLAGPVLAVCVMMNEDQERLCLEECHKVNDSKTLTPKERAKIRLWVEDHEIPFGVGLASEEEIDCVNILKATQLSMQRAIQPLEKQMDYCLVDGRSFSFSFPHQQIVGGDRLSLRVAIASIMAKEIRDERMRKMACEYPGFSFFRHKGYSTHHHVKELQQMGVRTIHRFSFRPVWYHCGFQLWHNWMEQGKISPIRFEKVCQRWEGQA